MRKEMRKGCEDVMRKEMRRGDEWEVLVRNSRQLFIFVR